MYERLNFIAQQNSFLFPSLQLFVRSCLAWPWHHWDWNRKRRIMSPNWQALV